MHITCFAIGLVTILLCIPSCKPGHSDVAERIDSLRVQTEAFIKTQSLNDYRTWVFGEPSNQDSLYKANTTLFSLDNIKLVRDAESQEVDSVQKKRLSYLRRYLGEEYVNKQSAVFFDIKNTIEVTTTVVVDGDTLPYLELSGLISNEPRQSRRRSLYVASATILDSLNKVLTNAEKANQQSARELGYASYNAMAEDLKQFTLNEFKVMAEHVLAETDSEYTALLAEVLRKNLNLTPGHFYQYDLGPLFRRAQFDKYFPAERMMDQLRRTYKGMGIEIDAFANLKIDAEKREGKNPRAVCFPIDIPNDIRLSIKPIGGFDDYGALFHEMGHGLHYANTRENAIEFKYLGEQTVTESFAFLSEYLLANQAWLRLHSNMPPTVLKDFVRMLAFERLYFVRRYCAQFLYEVQLHSGVEAPEQVYTDLVLKKIGCQLLSTEEKRYLTSVDPLYYSASYLRAWFLEAQLEAKLTADFGANWFENQKAGELLLSLWSLGDRLNGEEFVQRIGYDRISPDALLRQIHMMLVLSTKPKV